MENKQILSSTLPNIPGIARDLVNYGKWFLYEVVCAANAEVKYLLSTNNSDFLLNVTGEIISPMPQGIELQYNFQITFEDIPVPQTANYFAL